METTNSNISPYVHSFQYTNGATNVGTIDELIHRTKGIQKRINSIIERIHALDYGRLPPHIYFDIVDMINISDAIGVYRIYDLDSRRRTGSDTLWCKEQLSFERTLPNKEGKMFLSYFGDLSPITTVGGYVVVSLSEEGIRYLNGIARWVSPPTDVTV